VKSLIISIFCLINFAHAWQDKAIYGNDDRLDFTEITNPIHQKWALATAAMISKFTAREDYQNPDVFKIKSKMLSQNGVCEYQRFARQMTASDCSGFLISPDTLVTAGHCVRHKQDCKDWYWIFDYRSGYAPEGYHRYREGRTIYIHKKSVYSCKKIIKTAVTNSTGLDFAVIKLDRAVTDREPLRIRRKGDVSINANLVIAGYPSGLPVKVADNAKVRSSEDNHPYFVATTDSFTGNSGSAVINEDTGLVEGILVRGEQDYEYQKSKGKRCLMPVVCEEDQCQGEEVTKISEIIPYL
jgi:V8-like Glu-specific endopeptidase